MRPWWRRQFLGTLGGLWLLALPGCFVDSFNWLNTVLSPNAVGSVGGLPYLPASGLAQLIAQLAKYL
jgi:hypothetical protein